MYLGEGSYGCTYKPAMKCKGESNREPNSISKLLLKFNTADDLKGKDLLEPIDPTQQFFLFPSRVCQPNIGSMDPVENNLMKCGKYKYRYMNQTLLNSDLILMKNGGEDLVRFKVRPDEFYPFFRDFSNLLEGLVILNENNFVHFDIKPENIVVKKQADGSFHFRFIDFGLMTSVADFDSMNTAIFLNNYFVWPYDVRFLAPMFTAASLTDADINEFYRKGPDSYSRFIKSILYYDVQKPNFVNRYNGYKSPTKTAAQALKRRENLLMAVDTYSMGVTMASLYATLTGHRYTLGDVEYSTAGLSPEAISWHQEVAEKVSKPLFEMIESMIHPSWIDRMSPRTIVTTYQLEILPEMERLFTPAKVAIGLGLSAAPGGGKRKTRKSCRR